MKIFVYGTLLKGLQRERALSRSDFLGNGHIKGELYDLGRFPALKAGNNKVFGELYEVSEQILNHFDQIEGFKATNKAESLYIREMVDFHLADTSEIIITETYFYNRSVVGRSTLIPNGDYRDYRRKQGTLNSF